ncbi:MAG: c-type cytochrome [Hyphomicrobiales bacterium]
MDKWLENPKGVVSDTYMIYRQKDPAIRRKIVAYLETQRD